MSESQGSSSRPERLENLSFDESVPLIFDIGNSHHAAVAVNVSFNGMRDANDLFYMCTKLLLSGLKHVYRVSSSTTTAAPPFDLRHLSAQQVEFVRERMMLLGIFVAVDSSDASKDELSEEFRDIERRGEDLELWKTHGPGNGGITSSRHAVVQGGDESKIDDHVLVIGTDTTLFVVGYSLTINDIVDDDDCGV